MLDNRRVLLYPSVNEQVTCFQTIQGPSITGRGNVDAGHLSNRGRFNQHSYKASG